ncbi:hypothetical protein P7K49_032588, partial [Saguinus oedipus]
MLKRPLIIAHILAPRTLLALVEACIFLGRLSWNPGQTPTQGHQVPTELGNHYARWDACSLVALLVESGAVHSLHNCTQWPRPITWAQAGGLDRDLESQVFTLTRNHPPW